jgi:hypothetical protein
MASIPLRHARRFRRIHPWRHQRGIRVMIDLVVNHTSDQHPWFQDARSDPKSRYRDWYVWSDRSRQCQRGHGVSRRAEIDLDASTRSPSAGTFTASTTSSPTSTPPIRCAGRDPEDHGLLAAARRLRLPHGCGALRDRQEGRRGEKPTEQYDMLRDSSANSCNGARATPSSSPKPMCCRRPTWNISATTATGMQMMFNFRSTRTCSMRWPAPTAARWPRR